MNKSILILFTILFSFSIYLNAQPYLDGNRRYSFAQTVVGIDLQFIPQSGTSNFLTNSNALEKYNYGNTLIPRFTMSGLHFWGHAEFYLHIPLAHLNLSKHKQVKTDFSTAVETGLKIYPWRIEHHKWRPFIGLSMNTVYFRQSNDVVGNGTNIIKTRVPIHAGLTFNHKSSLIELGMSFYHHNEMDYYISRAIKSKTSTPPLTFNIGYKFYFDTTISASKGTENGYFDRKTKAMASEGLLDGLSLGLGFSSIFFVKESEYNNNLYPFLDHHKNGNVFFELGLGYYFFKKDLHLNLAYRKMGANLNAYDLDQRLSRQAITLEAFKFLGDYHGFVPFLGPAVSLERLKVREFDAGQQTLDLDEYKIAGGIIFGWDIRPTRLQSFILRTNLRYFPALHLKAENGKKISFDNIEFNFIQLVYYPGVTKRIQRFKL